MIDLEKLKNVKHLVTHANCPDGVAAALIVKDALPDVRVSFVQYNTKEHLALRPEPGTLFVDFTPHIPRFSDGLIDGHELMTWVGAGAMVLDHHDKQRAITENFAVNGLGVFGENDRLECGAWLAYEHVWRPIKLGHGPFNPHDDGESVREFAELAAVRDTWKRSDPRFERARAQGEVLLFWGEEALEVGLSEMIEKSMSDEAEAFASLLLKKAVKTAGKAVEESYRFQTRRGTRVLMFQNTKPTTEAAELLDKEPPDIVAGFHYRIEEGKLRLTYSMRSHAGYDVGDFAKSHPGGGGHAQAAGFSVDQSAEIGANPYAVFKILLEEWESGQ